MTKYVEAIHNHEDFLTKGKIYEVIAETEIQYATVNGLKGILIKK